MYIIYTNELNAICTNVKPTNDHDNAVYMIYIHVKLFYIPDLYLLL